MAVAASRTEADRLAAGLPAIRIAADRLAATVMYGFHGRRQAGAGDEFWQFRTYQSFDTSAAVDWRQSAKRDRVFVRQREWQVTRTAWLWNDRSPSMDYRSHRHLPSKRERAEIILLALANLLLAGDEAVALMDANMRPRAGRSVLDAITERLYIAGGDLPSVTPLPADATGILISDFLMVPAALETALKGLASAGAQGHLIAISDPAEEAFPFQGRIRFEGLEAEEPYLLEQADEVAAAYTRRRSEHRRQITDIAGRFGWRVIHHLTDTPAERLLLTIYSTIAMPAR